MKRYRVQQVGADDWADVEVPDNHGCREAAEAFVAEVAPVLELGEDAQMDLEVDGHGRWRVYVERTFRARPLLP